MRSTRRGCSSTRTRSIPKGRRPSTGMSPRRTGSWWPFRCRAAEAKRATCTCSTPHSGSRVHEVIPHVNGGTAGGDLAWLPDGSGFFYTRYPKAGERPGRRSRFLPAGLFPQARHADVRRPIRNGQGFPRVAEIEFEMDNSTGTLLTTVQNGDGGAILALPAVAVGEVEEDQQLRRSDRPGDFRPAATRST